MLATFGIEIALAIYTFVRYKMSTTVRLAITMLVFLGIFQLAEYNVCGHANTWAIVWSRIGYVAITMLPPLGLHLIHSIAKRKINVTVWIAYATGILFAATFGLSSTAFASHVCAGNYAIFQLTRPVGGLYFFYYYAWLFIGVCYALFYSIGAKKHIQEALVLQVFGYLSFLLPTGVVNSVNPQTIAGIPSVMCGFAVIYAIILAVGILPRAVPLKKAH